MNHSKAAYLNNRHAEDVSHMCFGEAVSVSMQSMLASHPPLEDRIKSVNTGFLKIQNAKNIIKKRQDEKASKINASDADKIHASTVNVVNSVGNPTAEHMMYALAMHRSLTPTIVSNIHKASGAKAIVYALILSDVEIDIAINYLVEHHQGQIIDSFKIVYESVKKINQRHKLPLIDLALPVLKQLNQSDRNEFLSTTEALIKLDKKYTFFEFVLFLILKKHLNENSSRVDKVNVYSFKSVCHELQLLLSLMIHASRQSQQKKIQVYKEHMSSFCSVVPDFLPVEQCKLKMIEKMLNKLSGLSPLLKKPVINACVEAILDDGIVMPMEAELLRAVSEMLDCPMPPLLDD